MKRIFLIFFIVTAMVVSSVSAETTPEDLLKAIDQMTPEQAHEVQTKLAARQWDPIPGGFFDRLAIKGSMVGMHTDDIDLSSLQLSSEQDLELDSVGGSEVSVLWQLFNEKFRAGFKAASLRAEDSNLGAGGYTKVELEQKTASLVANYQLIRTDAFLWWTEGALGGGNIALNILDTPAGGTSSLKYYDKEYGMGELSTGFDWRFNSELSLNGFFGYQFAEKVNLEEGGKETGLSMEPKGFKGGLGLAYNF